SSPTPNRSSRLNRNIKKLSPICSTLKEKTNENPPPPRSRPHGRCTRNRSPCLCASPDHPGQQGKPHHRHHRHRQSHRHGRHRHPADDAAKILDLAVKAGANQSGQIDWSLKDENTPQAEAAGKALQRARTVAGEMAKGLNVKLGALLYANNETQAQPPRPLMQAIQASAAKAQPPP